MELDLDVVVADIWVGGAWGMQGIGTKQTSILKDSISWHRSVSIPELQLFGEFGKAFFCLKQVLHCLVSFTKNVKVVSMVVLKPYVSSGVGVVCGPKVVLLPEKLVLGGLDEGLGLA